MIYPILLSFFARKSQKKEPVQYSRPSVSLIISAYNEIDVIRQKIANSLDLNYGGSFDVSVVSDASDDGTDEVAASFGNKVTLFRSPERVGKSAGLTVSFPTPQAM